MRSLTAYLTSSIGTLILSAISCRRIGSEEEKSAASTALLVFNSDHRLWYLYGHIGILELS